MVANLIIEGVTFSFDTRCDDITIKGTCGMSRTLACYDADLTQTYNALAKARAEWLKAKAPDMAVPLAVKWESDDIILLTPDSDNDSAMVEVQIHGFGDINLDDANMVKLLAWLEQVMTENITCFTSVLTDAERGTLPADVTNGVKDDGDFTLRVNHEDGKHWLEFGNSECFNEHAALELSATNVQRLLGVLSAAWLPSDTGTLLMQDDGQNMVIIYPRNDTVYVRYTDYYEDGDHHEVALVPELRAKFVVHMQAYIAQHIK